MEVLVGLLILLMIVLVIFVLQALNQIKGMKETLPKSEDYERINKRLQEADDSSRKSFERLAGNLGQLSEATQQMMEVGKTISNLEDLLKPPKLRGGFGETLLNQLLSQILPGELFQIQYRFKSGDIVDAVIILADRLVPVDSKFPLEQFRKMTETVDETTTKKAKSQFVRDVKKHIDDISSKYILPDERTFDFALMYLPAENIYYETIIKDELGEELFPYSIQKRVIPVSPNSFYAYLQVIIHGLRGLHIEDRARTIMDQLIRLQADEGSFRDEFNVLGSHLKNARNKFEETERKLNRFEDKLLTIGERIELPETSSKHDLD